jgi:plastocyanin
MDCSNVGTLCILLVSAITLCGCEDLVVHDASSLLAPRFQRSEVLGLVAGAPAVQAQAPAPPEIALTIEQHKFTPEEIKVKAGQAFVLVITNKDATPEEFESKELRVEKVVPGNKTLKVRMGALKPGTYKFFGEYHEATAKGKIIAE